MNDPERKARLTMLAKQIRDIQAEQEKLAAQYRACTIGEAKLIEKAGEHLAAIQNLRDELRKYSDEIDIHTRAYLAWAPPEPDPDADRAFDEATYRENTL